MGHCKVRMEHTTNTSRPNISAWQTLQALFLSIISSILCLSLCLYSF